MIKFEANLSSKSLTSLMTQLELHGKKLVQAQRDVLDALADYVMERIKVYTTNTEVSNSFIKEVANDIARVYTDLYYAKYVEFGTGIVGKNQNNSHPLYLEKGWVYDHKDHGEAGWVYPKKDGTWGRTSGQVAQKFVYKAVQDLEKDYIEIAKDVLRKKGLI